MKRAKDLLWMCAVEECGQDLVEYALIMAMIALGAVAGLRSLANVIASIPNGLMQKFYNAYNS